MESPPEILLISSRSINKHDRHRQFLFLIGRCLKIFSPDTAWPNEPKLGAMERFVLEMNQSETIIACGGRVS
jgi:hypothetical protein